MRISDWSSDVCSSDLGFKRSRQTGHSLSSIQEIRFKEDVDVVGAWMPGLMRSCPICQQLDPVRPRPSRDSIRPSPLSTACAASEGLSTRLWMIGRLRSEEHTSELQSLMRISYAVFCLKKKIRREQDHIQVLRTRYNLTKQM